MIHINNTKQMLFLVILSVAILPVSISAKNYEARENLDIKSRMNGIPVSEVGLLERIPGLGVQEIADRIFNRFKTDKGRKNIGALSLEDNVDCFKQKESDHFEIRQKDGKWKLKVWIDGTRFIVSDRDYIEKNNIERIPVSKRFSNDKLEQIGRKFIKDYLQDIVVLEPGEEIVPLWTEFELVSAMSENGEKVDDMITASMVHFGRKIDGINIVGGGSRISITVANNGAVVDVMLDWPRYRRSNEIQTAIGVSEIMERLFAYGKMVKGVNDVSLERFECGYYDPGVKYVDTYGFIQVGCVAYTVGLNKNEEGDFIHPVINVIPAGKIVEWDDNWPEAQAVINGRDLCEETDLSLCLKEY